MKNKKRKALVNIMNIFHLKKPPKDVSFDQV